MAETLEQGLSKIFGLSAQAGSAVPDGRQGTRGKPQGSATTKPSTSGGIPLEDSQERIRKALGTYEEALRAQKDGDWARYGEAIRRLGDILKR